MTLSDRLNTLSGNPELIRSRDKSLWRDEAINNLIDRSGLAGRRVAVQLTDPAEFLKALIALDGVAETVVLLSPALTPDLAAQLATQAGCDAILCDDPSGIEGIDAFGDLAPLAARGAADRPRPEATRWVMTTSGTTGTPKLVSHTLASLTRTTKTDPARSARARWGMLYDHSRFAGMQVLLQSALSGALLLAPNYDAPLEEKLDYLVTAGCTHLSGTPTLWRKIVMMPGNEALPLRQATLGGEIADDRVLSAVTRFFPAARVAHIFASTEAGVGFSVHDGRAGFPESYLSDPPNGVAIRVEDGRLYLRNALVEPAYLGSSAAFAGDDGWVDTGDAVEIADGRVRFLGRSSGVINVGGDKVHPETVEHVLLDHPLVSATRVYPMSNPITGALVAADVVLSDPGAEVKAARSAILGHAARQLARHQTPARLRIVDDLDFNAAGKLDRTGA